MMCPCDKEPDTDKISSAMRAVDLEGGSDRQFNASRQKTGFEIRTYGTPEVSLCCINNSLRR